MNKIIQETIEVLNKKGVILYPTDTIWGLGCLIKFPEAIEKIYSLKKRPSEKKCIILVSSIEMLQRYVGKLHSTLLEQISNFKKPTTFIFHEAMNLPQYILAPDGSIAIRIIQHPFCTRLIEELNEPLISTSANISGELSPVNFNYIHPEIFSKVNYIVSPKLEKYSTQQASDMYEIKPDKSLKKIR